MSDLRIGSLFMFDGTEFMGVSNVGLEVESDINTQADRNIIRNLNGEITINCNNVDAIFDVNEVNSLDKVDLEFTHLVQKRSHKKRRINKKWLKRYGLIDETVKPKGLKITNYTDDSFEFTKQ